MRRLTGVQDSQSWSRSTSDTLYRPLNTELLAAVPQRREVRHIRTRAPKQNMSAATDRLVRLANLLGRVPQPCPEPAPKRHHLRNHSCPCLYGAGTQTIDGQAAVPADGAPRAKFDRNASLANPYREKLPVISSQKTAQLRGTFRAGNRGAHRRIRRRWRSLSGLRDPDRGKGAY